MRLRISLEPSTVKVDVTSYDNGVALHQRTYMVDGSMPHWRATSEAIADLKREFPTEYNIKVKVRHS